MAALPADPSQQEDPLDPERILRSLPERERETFLAEYQRAVEEARDPACWSELRRFLRLWAWRAVAVAEPGGITRPGTAPGLARAGACCSRTRSGSIIPARELPALAGGAGLIGLAATPYWPSWSSLGACPLALRSETGVSAGRSWHHEGKPLAQGGASHGVNRVDSQPERRLGADLAIAVQGPARPIR